MALHNDSACLYCCCASLILPSISKNSPRLCVATAQPTSHSSVRSGGVISAARVRALVAHFRAWSTSAARGEERVPVRLSIEGVGEGDGDDVGGVC